MRVVAILQARLASTRLPRKVLADIGGRPMLAHVIERARAIRGVDAVVLTTPDEDLLPLGIGIGRWGLSPPWMPHEPPDVLTGFQRVAQAAQAEIVLRITGDCPLLAVDVADDALGAFLFRSLAGYRGAWDYVGTTRPDLAVPDGFDVEVVSREALEIAHREATGEDREHVTSFLWRQPERFRIGGLAPLVDPWALGLKLSVDDIQDLDRVRRILARVPAGDYSMAATLKAAKEEGL